MGGVGEGGGKGGVCRLQSYDYGRRRAVASERWWQGHLTIDGSRRKEREGRGRRPARGVSSAPLMSSGQLARWAAAAGGYREVTAECTMGVVAVECARGGEQEDES